jgi:sugar O-acyltransferase (sialic acid O-acetyltransferase NeuD family)
VTDPAAFQRIIIVGAGGFGREVVHWARAAWPQAAGRITGFLGADGGTRPVRDLPLPLLADPAVFEPQPGDGLVLAIGILGVRRRVTDVLSARGGTFLTLVHPTAVVAGTAALGPGSVVCPHAVISDSATLGRCVLVNYHASLAHDSAAGDFAVLSPYATLGGAARISDDVFLGLHATVGPGVRVGEGSKIAANSCALHDVPGRSLVYGVPGRVGPIV